MNPIDAWLNRPRDVSTCEKCGVEYAIGDWPFCPHGRYGRATFTPIEVDLGTLGKHTIGSIQDADRLTKMAKERGQEISFRAFENNPSNQDRNSMGENPQPKFSTRNRRGVPFVTRRNGR
jgi:hypothetical protein